MRVISIEGDTVYYGIRGACLFRPLKASIVQFKHLAGLSSDRGLRLIANGA